MAHIQLELGQYDQARSDLDVVTNANYASLKVPLERDLNKAPAKAKTNAPTPADGGK
jgi:predicted negative regulator of RcsB-dependent stress response